MSDDRSPADERSPGGNETEKRRRRARVFGEVLPERTSDELPDSDEDSSRGSDDWLRRQRPPHHD